MIYIFWTAANREEAKKISRALIEKELVACASILPDVESIYHWKGKVEEKREVKVILKTLISCYNAIQEYIINHGSYEVPEILEIPIDQGNPRYLSWIFEEIEHRKR